MNVRFEVPSELASLGPVRDVLDHAIALWRTPVDREQLLLLATELLTNAVDHGSPPITVSMEWDETVVRVEVADGTGTAPVLGDPDPEDADGRGMWLVARMASAWGTDRRDDGKAVWFELAASATAARPSPAS